jgi:hypothetical protein
MATNLTPARLRLLASVMLLVCMQSNAATAPPASQRDGVHDFDFLIGDWKAHVRRLPDRRILTVCSSVNRVFFMTLSPTREPSSQRISWPENRPAGQSRSSVTRVYSEDRLRSIVGVYLLNLFTAAC